MDCEDEYSIMKNGSQSAHSADEIIDYTDSLRELINNNIASKRSFWTIFKFIVYSITESIRKTLIENRAVVSIGKWLIFPVDEAAQNHDLQITPMTIAEFHKLHLDRDGIQIVGRQEHTRKNLPNSIKHTDKKNNGITINVNGIPINANVSDFVSFNAHMGDPHFFQHIDFSPEVKYDKQARVIRVIRQNGIPSKIEISIEEDAPIETLDLILNSGFYTLRVQGTITNRIENTKKVTVSFDLYDTNPYTFNCTNPHSSYANFCFRFC